MIRKTERDHYDNLLTQNKHNISKSWQIIKEVINKKQNNSTGNTFVIDNKEISDNKVIVESFNDFFVNIGPNLAKSILNVAKDATDYIPNQYQSSMFVNPTCSNEVKNIIMALKDSSPGYDGIKSNILKVTCNSFIAPLTHTINVSLSQGVFPDELKVAKVIPLYKSNDKKCINNYRPVSILPVFSKLFECIMYRRLMSFIKKHKLLYPNQFGFRENHGTNIALTFLYNKILKSLDNGDYVLGLFLDFKKAFDTVNHDILLRKLYKYGIRGTSFDWIKSYLSNRKQYVYFNQEKSTALTDIISLLYQ